MLKFKLSYFSTIMNKPPQIRLDTTPTILFVLGAILSLLALIAIYTHSTSLLTWNEYSELLPVFSKVDAHNSFQLDNQLFLIRQSYYINFLEIDPNIFLFYSIAGIIGIAYLMIGFQKWSKINPRQFIFGIILWVGIVAYNNMQQGLNDWILLLQQQIGYAGIIVVFIWAIISSQAIPSFIVQLSFQFDKKNNTQIWYLLGVFYLVNLILSFGNMLNYWDSTFHLPSYIFWIVSSILFLLQTMKFQDKTQQIIYFGMFLLAISTYIVMYVQHNDPGIKAIETWGLMCQIVMVIIFPAFIYTNFKELIPSHLPIFKVFHKAQKLPIYLIHIGIFLLAFSWVFALNTAVFHQIMAGKSNQDGDNAYVLKEYNLAEIHYKNALVHSKLNSKSNISLARLAQEKNLEEEQAYYLSNTLVKNPQAETYIALSHLYAKNNHIFESLFNLKKGLALLPENSHLLNQVAINYEKLNQLDSAKYFYRQAFELAPKDELAIANYIYFESKYAQNQVVKQLLNHQNSSNRVIQNNLLLYKATHNLPLPKATISADFEPQMDVRDWAILYNTTSLLKEKAPLYSYAKWKKNPDVQKFFPEVAFLEAWQNYYHQKPLLGLDQLSLIISQDTSSKSKGYPYILGYWKEVQLTSTPTIQISNLLSAKKALEKYPFNISVLLKAFPILNQHKEQKLAYYYALSALRYNEQIPEYYPIYALQALELSEITYANEAMELLKRLNPELYRKELANFENKKQEVLKMQKF
jgi:Flp pilus assembly protein TadD